MGSSAPVSFRAGISQPRCCALKYGFFVLKAPVQAEVKPLPQVRDGDLRITPKSWPSLSLQSGFLSTASGMWGEERSVPEVWPAWSWMQGSSWSWKLGGNFTSCVVRGTELHSGAFWWDLAGIEEWKQRVVRSSKHL